MKTTLRPSSIDELREIKRKRVNSEHNLEKKSEFYVIKFKLEGMTDYQLIGFDKSQQGLTVSKTTDPRLTFPVWTGRLLTKILD